MRDAMQWLRIRIPVRAYLRVYLVATETKLPFLSYVRNFKKINNFSNFSVLGRVVTVVCVFSLSYLVIVEFV